MRREITWAGGLDDGMALAIIDRLHAEFREPSSDAAPPLRHVVCAGFSGRKAGRGFHVHES